MKTRGDLRWAVKESFRQYLEQVEGVVEVSGGAALADDGRIVFPQVGAESVDGVPKILRFGGGVQFTAHEGLLSVRLRSPWVEFTDDGAVLTVMHPAFRDTTDTRLALCRLDIDAPPMVDDSITLLDAPAALLIDGTGTFDNLYRPGDAFAPVSFEVHLGGADR